MGCAPPAFGNWAGERFKAWEVSLTQYNALRILRAAGAQGLSCTEIGERLINRDPDIKRKVIKLLRRNDA
jgi:hypothetical protein